MHLPTAGIPAVSVHPLSVLNLPVLVPLQDGGDIRSADVEVAGDVNLPDAIPGKMNDPLTHQFQVGVDGVVDQVGDIPIPVDTVRRRSATDTIFRSNPTMQVEVWCERTDTVEEPEVGTKGGTD
jgi:hypothetical protein